MGDPLWRCLPLARVPVPLLYQALALRSRVFVVEQQSLYQDLDGADLQALMVLGSTRPAPDAAAELFATARILPPAPTEPSIGRVCVAAAHRRQGLGRSLMAFAIRSTRAHHPGVGIRISAQCYLQRFYESFGFEVCGPAYDEDGIAHRAMRLPASTP